MAGNNSNMQSGAGNVSRSPNNTFTAPSGQSTMGTYAAPGGFWGNNSAPTSAPQAAPTPFMGGETNNFNPFSGFQHNNAPTAPAPAAPAPATTPEAQPAISPPQEQFNLSSVFGGNTVQAIQDLMHNVSSADPGFYRNRMGQQGGGIFNFDAPQTPLQGRMPWDSYYDGSRYNPFTGFQDIMARREARNTEVWPSNEPNASPGMPGYNPQGST